MMGTRYPHPLKPGQEGRQLHLDTLETTPWQPDGLLPGNAYRELALGAATGGRVGLRHLLSTAAFEKETGWHWHDMDAHAVFVIRGHITFRFRDIDGEHVVRAGECITQPAGVPHNVVDRSSDLELLEVTLPQRFSTMELDTSEGPEASEKA
ncbi:MAG TPA: cupin domain-containing protein [Lautropia sp.]|nr:cupin domain-containing protein [Lautropia sp.]